MITIHNTIKRMKVHFQPRVETSSYNDDDHNYNNDTIMPLSSQQQLQQQQNQQHSYHNMNDSTTRGHYNNNNNSNNQKCNTVRSTTTSTKNDVYSIMKLLYTTCFVLSIIHTFVILLFCLIPKRQEYIRSSTLFNHNTTTMNLLYNNIKFINDPTNQLQQQRSTSLRTSSHEKYYTNQLPIETSYEDSQSLPYSRPYPRWGETLDDEQQHGIDIIPLLDFITNSSVAMYISQQSNTPLKDKRYVPTSDHQGDVGSWLPETLYVIDENGILHNSLRHRTCIAYGKGNIKDKVIPIERSILSAIEYLKQSNTNNTSCLRWPNLCDTIFSHKNKINNNSNNNNKAITKNGGFPFLLYYGDYTGCNYQNYQNNQYSIPMFTAAAHVQCNYAFPFVTHEILEMIKDTSEEWDDFFIKSNTKYTWQNKIPQVVWRGALTGKYVNDTYKNTRWNLLRTINTVKQAYTNIGYDEDSFLFNVGPVRFPTRPETKHWKSDIDPELGGFTNRIDPMDDFQKYRAILDMDGNSWSSRFNLLLCYNSVIIKVEPTWVDYLQFNQRKGILSDEKVLVLLPWKHYIPVKADLSDLFEIASFVNDPKNDNMLQEIVHNANQWCRHNLIKRSIDVDVLNILERYVELLNVGNPNWRSQHWGKAKKSIFHIDSQLRMKSISWNEDEDYGQDEVLAYKKLYGVPF